MPEREAASLQAQREAKPQEDSQDRTASISNDEPFSQPWVMSVQARKGFDEFLQWWDE